MPENEWLTLNFTLPKEPSRIRVSIWRKLKKCGSVNIGQSIWLLPVSEENISIFKAISKEIFQHKGIAYVMKSIFITETIPENNY